ELFVALGWKNIAGKDLDTGEDIRLRLTRKIRAEVLANRIKMAYYYYLNEEYGLSVVALFRAQALPHAKTDIDIFSFAGNLRLLERIRSEFTEEEYLLFKNALINRTDAAAEKTEKKLLLAGINKLFLQARDNFFQLQHNLQYYVYAMRRGSINAWVNYNGAITSALHHYMNKNPDESARQLSKLTLVTDLGEQLKEYARLGVLEVRN
ncbi:MAG: hypothetical protein OET44_21585, partial [Gammaproteobacteria bacterium]|nr:hypothetical protein [Gammaproteobacteria bacterium]